MPLQSRVDPFGTLFASASRGLLMGNRGGRIHDGERRLGARQWASKQWICCQTKFKERHRKVWGDSYTELFFLDEPTAFAAGHRPCFECRRKAADLFALYAGKLRAAEMDSLLHAQRLDGKDKKLHKRDFAGLPDGAFVDIAGVPYAVRGPRLIRWTPLGYEESVKRPLGGKADVLTPPLMLKVLARGYPPLWHPSAG